MDHISLIIVHYNTDRDTIECLDSLSAVTSNQFDLDIVIVDNGSKEPLVLPAKHQRKHISVIRSESNLGFTGGNNLGIRSAIDAFNSDYVLLINSDTYVDPTFLEHLYQQAINNPTVGLLNPKIYFAKGYEFHTDSYTPSEKGKVLWFAGGTTDWNDVASFHRGVDEVDRGHFDFQTQTDFATGCCLLIKREVIETVGLLNEQLFLYWEDVDYSLRVRAAGYELLVVPESVIWHKNAGSSDGSGSEIHTYYQTRNRLYIAFKHGTVTGKISATKLLTRFLQGTPVERMAAQDAVMGKMGKRPVI